jgi:hypothetical protein
VDEVLRKIFLVVAHLRSPPRANHAPCLEAREPVNERIGLVIDYLTGRRTQVSEGRWVKKGCTNIVCSPLLAAGVYDADTYARSGTFAQKPPLPYTPGIDGAGLVEAVGVVTVKPGDRVYIARSVSGTYAEYALALESQVHPLPELEPSTAQVNAGRVIPRMDAGQASFLPGSHEWA